jgi:hypothetical protein
VYGQVETGYDYPEPRRGRVRPGTLASRLIIALILGACAGLAVMLGVRGFGTLITEAGGSCGTSSTGGSYGACPRGITPAIIITFVVGIWAVPAAIALLFRKGWPRRGVTALGVAGGLLAGQALFGIWHGSDLAVAWTAPFDSSDQLTTVGAWATGGSLVRVRVDEVVSYDAATGLQQWSVPIPGTDVACALSGLGAGTGAESGTGLILYGSDSSTCDHVMAIDLSTGRQLWASALPSPDDSAVEIIGQLAITGGTAVVLTDDGPMGLSVSSGARLWGPARPGECSVRQLAGSGSSLVALGSCFTGSGTETSYDVFSFSPATGKQVWDHRVSDSADAYSPRILSVSPLLIGEEAIGPRATSMVRVLGPDGTQLADFPVGGITLAGSPVALSFQPTDGFGSPDVVTGGMLIGVTAGSDGQDAIAAYRLSDGQRQWVVDTPDEVNDITVAGDSIVYVDESDPAYSLEKVSPATGKLTSLGFFSQGALESGDSGLYAIGGTYVIVNQHGDRQQNTPVAGIKVPAAKG